MQGVIVNPVTLELSRDGSGLVMSHEEFEAARKQHALSKERAAAGRRRAMEAERDAIALRLASARADLEAASKAIAGTKPADPSHARSVQAKADGEVAVARLTARLAHIKEELRKCR
jgi:hypothetical protein